MASFKETIDTIRSGLSSFMVNILQLPIDNKKDLSQDLQESNRIIQEDPIIKQLRREQHEKGIKITERIPGVTQKSMTPAEDQQWMDAMAARFKALTGSEPIATQKPITPAEDQQWMDAMAARFKALTGSEPIATQKPITPAEDQQWMDAMAARFKALTGSEPIATQKPITPAEDQQWMDAMAARFKALTESEPITTQKPITPAEDQQWMDAMAARFKALTGSEPIATQKPRVFEGVKRKNTNTNYKLPVQAITFYNNFCKANNNIRKIQRTTQFINRSIRLKSILNSLHPVLHKIRNVEDIQERSQKLIRILNIIKQMEHEIAKSGMNDKRLNHYLIELKQIIKKQVDVLENEKLKSPRI